MTLSIVRPGMLTTVQDLGRFGGQAVGIPVAGPMDWWSHEAANRLVSNPSDAALLEITLIGPELEFGQTTVAAVCGAHFELSVSGPRVPARRVAMNRPFEVKAGVRLSFGARTRGARAYLALGGGIRTPLRLGSRATHVRAGMGGHDGRALRRGDVLPLGPAATQQMGTVSAGDEHLPDGEVTTLRAIEGPDDTDPAFWRADFPVSPTSDRMGYRLDGQIAPARGDYPSAPVAFGTVQVTPSGHCVLLMADRATSGGYARAATVITADLPRAGQLAPGDTVRFSRVSMAEALAAVEAMRHRLPGGGT